MDKDTNESWWVIFLCVIFIDDNFLVEVNEGFDEGRLKGALKKKD